MAFKKLVPIPADSLKRNGGKIGPTEHGSFWLKVVRTQSSSVALSHRYWKYRDMAAPDDAVDKIARDVGRTYPESRLFRYEASLCQQELTDVLLAWVNFEFEYEKEPSKRCGYVQGMNVLVGHLLQHVGESIAFEIFVHMMLNKHYDFKALMQPGMRETIAKVNHLSELSQRKCGFLLSCLSKNNISPITFSTQWILTLYTYVLDGELLWLVWDNFFLYGWDFFFNITIEFMKALEERLKQAIDGKILESYINGHSGDMMTVLYNAIRNIATRNTSFTSTNDDPIGGSKVIQSRSPENWIQRALSSLDIIMNTRATDAYVEAEDPGSASDSDCDGEEAKQMSEANAGFDYHAKLIVDEQDFKHFTVSDDDKERLLNNAWVEKNSILRKNAIQFLKYNVRHEIGALEAYTTKRGTGEQNGTPISGVGSDESAVTPSDILQDIRIFRYMKGCKFDLRQAIIKLKNTLQWRLEEGIEDISSFLMGNNDGESCFPNNEICSKLWPATILHGKFDRAGQPILIERFGKCDLTYLNKDLGTNEIIEWVIHRLEYRQLILSKLSQQRGEMIRYFGIVDLSGLGFQHCSTSLYDVGKKILKVSTTYFPEAMSNICVINTPYVFSTIFAAIQPLLPERTQKKIRILGHDYHSKLLEFVEEKNLPMEYRLSPNQNR